MLVGDLIVRMRELGPDPCQVLPPPAPGAVTSVSNAGGQLSPAVGAYFLIFSQFSQWGETLGAAEVTGTVLPLNNALSIPIPIVPGAVKIRCYIGTVTGQETQYQDFTVTAAIGATQTVIVTGGTASGTPPQRSRAYLPDTDGAFVGSATAYAWLGEALLALSKASQGVYDFTGMASSNGQPLYQLNGIWESLDHGWYDGWIMDIGNKASIYYRNRIATSISGMMVAQRIAETMTVELFPQPNRNANITTLAGNGGQISASTTSALIAASNFVLPMGLAQIGPTATQAAEIVAYAFNSNGALTGMVRGIGGTVAQSWPDGTTVTELNIRCAGRRIVTPYAVGASASSIPVPPEWAIWLPNYMLARFRTGEGEHKIASELMQEFVGIVDKLGKGNKQRMGPRQIGAGPQVGEVYGGTLGGGWLLP